MLEAKIENDPHSFSMVWPDAFLRAFLCSREHAILPKIAASKLLVSSDTLGLTASAGSVAWSCALETHQPRLVSVRKPRLQPYAGPWQWLGILVWSRQMFGWLTGSSWTEGDDMQPFCCFLVYGKSYGTCSYMAHAAI